MHLNKKIVGLLVIGVAILLLPAAKVEAATTVGTNVSVAGTLAATGATTLSDALTVSGATILSGTATLSSTLTVTGLATFDGGFISASSTVTRLNVSGNLNASGTLFMGANILPDGNKTRNIGAYGTALNNIYASSTLYAASSTIFNSSSSTIFLNSGNSEAGGRIILKGSSNTTCYQIYFGAVGAADLGMVTSTVTCPNN